MYDTRHIVQLSAYTEAQSQLQRNRARTSVSLNVSPLRPSRLECPGLRTNQSYQHLDICPSDHYARGIDKVQTIHHTLHIPTRSIIDLLTIRLIPPFQAIAGANIGARG